MKMCRCSAKMNLWRKSDLFYALQSVLQPKRSGCMDCVRCKRVCVCVVLIHISGFMSMLKSMERSVADCQNSLRDFHFQPEIKSTLIKWCQH